MLPIKTMSLADFETFIYLPENQERHFEYIAGEISEVVSNNYSSEIAANLLISLGAYVKAQRLGRLWGADGGFMVGEERYIPDIAFITKERQAASSKEAYNRLAPDLAVEVLSPNDNIQRMCIKLVNYLNVGTTVWLVDPEEQSVIVYRPNQKPLIVNAEGTLSGDEFLPNFQLAVKDIFLR